jgi:hypothetical protein
VLTKKKKRLGRPPKRYKADTVSSVDDDSLQVPDEIDSIASADMDAAAVDFDDDVLGVDMTNKPLSELLRVSNIAGSAHSSMVPEPVSLLIHDTCLFLLVGVKSFICVQSYQFVYILFDSCVLNGDLRDYFAIRKREWSRQITSSPPTVLSLLTRILVSRSLKVSIVLWLTLW